MWCSEFYSPLVSSFSLSGFNIFETSVSWLLHRSIDLLNTGQSADHLHISFSLSNFYSAGSASAQLSTAVEDDLYNNTFLTGSKAN